MNKHVFEVGQRKKLEFNRVADTCSYIIYYDGECVGHVNFVEKWVAFYTIGTGFYASEYTMEERDFVLLLKQLAFIYMNNENSFFVDGKSCETLYGITNKFESLATEKV